MIEDIEDTADENIKEMQVLKKDLNDLDDGKGKTDLDPMKERWEIVREELEGQTDKTKFKSFFFNIDPKSKDRTAKNETSTSINVNKNSTFGNSESNTEISKASETNLNGKMELETKESSEVNNDEPEGPDLNTQTEQNIISGLVEDFKRKFRGGNTEPNTTDTDHQKMSEDIDRMLKKNNDTQPGTHRPFIEERHQTQKPKYSKGTSDRANENAEVDIANKTKVGNMTILITESNSNDETSGKVAEKDNKIFPNSKAGKLKNDDEDLKEEEKSKSNESDPVKEKFIAEIDRMIIEDKPDKLKDERLKALHEMSHSELLQLVQNLKKIKENSTETLKAGAGQGAGDGQEKTFLGKIGEFFTNLFSNDEVEQSRGKTNITKHKQDENSTEHRQVQPMEFRSLIVEA